jgi:hypothetical protein
MAQHDASVFGTVTDTSGTPLGDIRVRVKDARESSLSSTDGKFSLKLQSGKPYEIEFLYLGQLQKKIHIEALQPKEARSMGMIRLEGNFGSTYVLITDSSRKINRHMQTMNPHNFDDIPNVEGGIEGILKTLAGVSSNNELSSQYSVRGGNYDENLVYINDIEVYRPQLVRSGQEEGLSIINTDMVQSLQFSAGGFEAKYGDKLASVLDIHYKEPDSFAMKTNLSLLGASVEAEGNSKDNRFKYLAGVRYRSSKYILNSLDVQGDYQPTFLDVQAYLTYDLTDKLRIGYLSYYGNNQYLSVPQTQTTEFGTATNAAQLLIAFDGQQILQYDVFLNGLTLDYHPNKRNDIKFINSFYNTTESENYDIVGAYKLQELNSNLGSAGFGSANYTFGLGEFLNHARNSFYSEIYNSEVKGFHSVSKSVDLLWGIKYQHEHVEASLNEYQYVDSVDYSVPQTGNPRTQLNVKSYLYSRQNEDWNRYSGYVQSAYALIPKYNCYLTAGVRANYWDFNRELLISPRAQLTYEPNADFNRRIIMGGYDDSLMKKNIRLRASAGIYQQPPFFKELFAPDGSLVPGIKAQKSSHFVLGSDISFKMWDRPFKWTTEMYYKYMWDLIPYEIDNVHITYLGQNNATGYATGIDFQLNGELVKDAPSWVSLSLLQTAENIIGDSYIKTDPKTLKQSVVYPGYIPRPTDQRVRFSLFFQDYLPNHPSYKVHLNLVFGSGLPFGPPNLNKYQDTLRLPPYRRVDIGFSKLFWDKSKQHSKSRVINAFRSIWFSVEVFNLFQINNTVAYLWVQDIDGYQWAVPSYLTSRRLNLHLELKF